ITSVGVLGTDSGIEIYPNPTQNEWNITLKDDNNGGVNFQLYSADGRISRTLLLQAGTVNKVNAADLPTGLYFYRIISGTNVYTGSLMKN
ncbi:MAG: T9SS type A sorting domain-containing protein, partial [Taibaiella sp.]|nr:T9SS type A sorting domain-containing protein [Taibaiella sp.]